MKLENRRLPSYPLFLKDPYFSLWSASDKLNESNTVFWHGEEKPMHGYVEIEGEKFAFLGLIEGAIKLDQRNIYIDAFSTTYDFECEKFSLKVEFFSPLPPDELKILSCPTCYLVYEINCKQPIKELKVVLEIEERVAYNTCQDTEREAEVRSNFYKGDNYETASFGLRRQMPLSHSSDEIGADWGYYYICGEKAENCELNGRKYIRAYNTCRKTDNYRGKFVVGFDDTLSIFYYGEWLSGYFFSDGLTIYDALDYAYDNYEYIKDYCKNFDNKLLEKTQKLGEDYTFILYAALRQTMAGHKLVKDKKNRVLFLSKEFNSDGCIATVDVTYPSMPLFLCFNPSLITSMMTPIFDFARCPVWQENYAPHDAGVYPYCLGQYYGINFSTENGVDNSLLSFSKAETLPLYYKYPKNSKIYNDERQMPVEECGNMLIMSALTLNKRDNKIISENFDLLKKWAEYLVQYGLVPHNQLSSDDFSGHMSSNANLSIKAILGIGAFSKICAALGEANLAGEYEIISKTYAEKWRTEYMRNGHSVLALNLEEDSYSLKYNLAIDDLLGTKLFDTSFKENEIDYYLTKMAKYGAPLDLRNRYTKSDWMMWTAFLTNDIEKRKIFVNKLANYLSETPSRVPFSDWYDADTASYIMFRNRTVQGGLFILLL